METAGLDTPSAFVASDTRLIALALEGYKADELSDVASGS